MGQTKQRVNKTNAKQRGRDAAGHVKPGEDAFVISAGVWGQLAPLDKIAREKTAKWGDTLPSLVAPELAGRFEAAYAGSYTLMTLPTIVIVQPLVVVVIIDYRHTT